MMPIAFFTGFPGFLGSELLPRILARRPDQTAVCLVQAKFTDLANRRLAELRDREPSLESRVRIIEGDITVSGFGSEELRDLMPQVADIFHLAAIYDLGVARDLAMLVNVDGTRNVLEFARGCSSLGRLHYVSTCYVSGKYQGTFTEGHLQEGQSFNNFYEETKYLAEIEVQEAMSRGLPATIYRPAIVAGDSTTGSTQKFDGLYYMIQWLLRQPRLAAMPVVGDPRGTEFNVVPRDFVLDAITYLSGLDDTVGEVFNLADPHPLTVDELLRELARSTRRRILRLPLSVGMAKGAISGLPGVYRLMRVPASAVDYMVHPTRYGTERAQSFLEPAGILVPPLPAYVDRLVEFVRSNPQIGSAAMS
ncbi:SDR family oxidoreductase [soil metagenome]